MKTFLGKIFQNLHNAKALPAKKQETPQNQEEPQEDSIDLMQQASSAVGRAFVNITNKPDLQNVSESKFMTNAEIDDFNISISELSNSLKSLSDEEYTDLSIEQEYSQTDFIKNCLSVIQGLEPEQQKEVFNYFGFELHKINDGRSLDIMQKKGVFRDYTMTGYPENNGNLSDTSDDTVRKTIEQISPMVDKFTVNNEIKSNNPQIAQELNTIAKYFPEIRTMIGKIQHKTHAFDVIKHSLKVMQKIAQNPNYEKLNETDKNIMLIAALFHDITKTEGGVDENHAETSADDMAVITQRLNLPKDKAKKLHTLAYNHEWLKFVNSGYSEEDTEERINEVASTFKDGNLFDLAMIFTEADLKAVKRDDYFYEKYGGAAVKFGERISQTIRKLRN
ncbi:HD domain-containing protein [bacterium]|nr:HD domain-containing protein [bacterium]